MMAPAFWWRPVGWQARALAPLGWGVGAVAAARLKARPRARVSVPVICVGNPTVGGAGKTPLAIAIAEHLASEGASPVFLLRGYRGRLKGPLAVGQGHTAADVGDEAALLATHRPTVISGDRAAGGALAATLGDVIVMDDGFHNNGLAKDFSLLAVDRIAGLGNARVVPAGPLRAPLAAHARHAQGVVLVDGGDGEHAGAPPLGTLADLPRYGARLVPQVAEPLQGARLLAFAGIGRPQKFFATLTGLGAAVVRREPFADHHPYGERDARRLLDWCVRENLRAATTRKDAVRLQSGGSAARELAEAALVVDVRAELDPRLTAAVSELYRRAQEHSGKVEPVFRPECATK